MESVETDNWQAPNLPDVMAAEEEEDEHEDDISVARR